MPIIGTIASSTRQGQNVDTGAMFAINSVYVGAAGSSSITFSNIPGTYKHLQIRGMARDNRVDTLSSIGVRFNGDTANNYAWHGARAYDTSTTYAQGASDNRIELDRIITAASSTSGTFSPIICDIADYASGNKNKTLKVLGSAINSGANNALEFYSGLWLNTAAITSITLVAIYGSFVENTRFVLYGVKG